MDIKLGEAIKTGRVQEHIKMSAEFADKLLIDLKVNEKTKEVLLNCVEAHHGTAPYKSLEAEIVANADCYRFIQTNGFLGCFESASKILGEHNILKQIEFAEMKLEEKHNTLSLDVAKEELEEQYLLTKKFIAYAKQNIGEYIKNG